MRIGKQANRLSRKKTGRDTDRNVSYLDVFQIKKKANIPIRAMRGGQHAIKGEGDEGGEKTVSVNTLRLAFVGR